MKYKRFVISFALVLLSSSCSNALAGYAEVSVETMESAPVFQIANPYFSTAFNQVSVTVSWKFASTPIFFPADSNLNRDQVKQLMRFINFSDDIEQSSYVCRGTSFISWTKRVETDPVVYTLLSERFEGTILTPYLCSNIEKHTLKSNDSSKEDIVYYIGSDAPIVSCIAK